MRQVPEPSYIIIGAGQMARHFAHYLDLSYIPYQQWFRQSQQPFSKKIVSQSNHVLLLINDGAIESFIQQHDFLRDKVLIHFSGSLQTDLAHSVHPLMTFGDELYSLETYQKIPFILEQGGKEFKALFPKLPNRSFYISSEQKPYYHCLCVMANNFTTILWQKFFDEMQTQFEIPKEVLLPYLQQTLLNLEHDHIAALTGPIARNDGKTIDANLASLRSDRFYDVYKSFVESQKFS